MLIGVVNEYIIVIEDKADLDGYDIEFISESFLQ